MNIPDTSAYYVRGFIGKYSFLSNDFPCKLGIQVFKNICGISSNLVFTNAQSTFLYMQAYWNGCSKTILDSILHDKYILSDILNKIPSTPSYRQVKAMENVIKWKFAQNPDLRRELENTEKMHLENSHKDEDTFWGVSYKSSNPVGQNILGRLLMKSRSTFILNSINYPI